MFAQVQFVYQLQIGFIKCLLGCRVLRPRENLELVQIVEPSLDRRLKHGAFAEVVECGQLEVIHARTVLARQIEHIGECLAVVVRNIKPDHRSRAALLVEVVESRISDTAHGAKHGSPQVIEIRLVRKMVVEAPFS